jgi:hypothetical protein
MQSFHLTSFIASPSFWETAKTTSLPYDVLLSDIFHETPPFPQYGPRNKPPKQALLPFREEIVKTFSHPLIILDSLPLSALQHLLQLFPDKPFTIINLYVGMGSISRKLAPEGADLTFLPSGIANYEPIDVANFFSILEQPHAKYLRIPHLHFPENIFSTQDIAIIDAHNLHHLEVLSLKSYGYAGEEGTIIATGANFPTALQVGDILQEQGKGLDIFVCTTLGKMTEEMKSSLHQTQKLFFIIDHVSQGLKNIIEKRLKAEELNNINVQLLTPKYEKLTTIFDEFSAEQADFDAKGLVERMLF